MDAGHRSVGGDTGEVKIFECSRAAERTWYYHVYYGAHGIGIQIIYWHRPVSWIKKNFNIGFRGYLEAFLMNTSMQITIRKIVRYFFSGTLFIVPLVATAYFIFISFQWLDNLLGLPYPGLGFLIIFGVITLFGYLTTNFAFKTVIDLFDHAVNKIPFVKLIYSSIKDLIGAFVGDKKKFNKPVLVEMNRENNLYQIGFITQSDLSELGLNDMVSVYLPHSYAVSGFHYIVSKDRIKPLNVSGPIAMKYIISGGVSGFKE
jgi:uncharacterized membrane protein